jgi:hypothetical protein
MNTIQKLKFHGPYTICSEENDVLNDCPYASDEGIYLWVVKMSSGSYRVSYIGETGISFYKRTKEHLIQTLGGNYLICDPEDMVRGRNNVIWKGLWRKETRNKMPDFLSHYESMAPKIKKSILIQKLFVAPTNIDRRFRQRIEGVLAFAIREDAEASSLLPNDIRYIRRRDDEDPTLISISSNHRIEGLPETIYA